MSDPTIPRPVTPAEAARDRESAALARKWSAAHVTPDEARAVARAALMGAPYVVLALGIAAAAWWTLEHALPYVSALALTALVAAMCFARGEA